MTCFSDTTCLLGHGVLDTAVCSPECTGLTSISNTEAAQLDASVCAESVAVAIAVVIGVTHSCKTNTECSVGF